MVNIYARTKKPSLLTCKGLKPTYNDTQPLLGMQKVWRNQPIVYRRLGSVLFTGTCCSFPHLQPPLDCEHGVVRQQPDLCFKIVGVYVFHR